MPENLVVYLLLVLALGIGFLLGRRERKRKQSSPGMVAQEYFRGLNHLLNERHDLAIDTFVEAMAVDSDTVDTHLALGSLVRRRGEVDRAIRIHQNLLARPVLSPAHRAQTELELARDYLSAGLLDRAENLLLELVKKPGDDRDVARTMLLEIYQREREWERAVEVARELSRADRSYRTPLAHFQCELAEKALADGERTGTCPDRESGRGEEAGHERGEGQEATAAALERLELGAARTLGEIGDARSATVLRDPRRLRHRGRSGAVASTGGGAARRLGGAISMPLLAAVFSAVGLFGAHIIAVNLLGVDAGAFWQQMQSTLSSDDVYEGILKSVVFGVVASLLAVWEGYNAIPTAEGVGRATTRTVVITAIAVLAPRRFRGEVRARPSPCRRVPSTLLRRTRGSPRRHDRRPRPPGVCRTRRGSATPTAADSTGR